MAAVMPIFLAPLHAPHPHLRAVRHRRSLDAAAAEPAKCFANPIIIISMKSPGQPGVTNELTAKQ